MPSVRYTGPFDQIVVLGHAAERGAEILVTAEEAEQLLTTDVFEVAENRDPTNDELRERLTELGAEPLPAKAKHPELLEAVQAAESAAVLAAAAAAAEEAAAAADEITAGAAGGSNDTRSKSGQED